MIMLLLSDCLSDVPEITCFVHQTTSLQIRRVHILPNDEDTDVPVRTQERAAWQPVQNINVSLDEIVTHFAELFARLGSTPEEHLLFSWTGSAILMVDHGSHQGADEKPKILDHSAAGVDETDRNPGDCSNVGPWWRHRWG